MTEKSGCKFTGINKDYSIEDLAAFHGHLGPFIVLGYRMGKYARERFCKDPFQLRAQVFCSGIPPESCIADGVQIGSGCTIGKRNIEIVVKDEVKCEFISGENKLVTRPKPIRFPPQSDSNYSELIERLAEDMYCAADSELFDIVSDGCGN